jgi:hypothetical protein
VRQIEDLKLTVPKVAGILGPLPHSVVGQLPETRIVDSQLVDEPR